MRPMQPVVRFGRKRRRTEDKAHCPWAHCAEFRCLQFSAGNYWRKTASAATGHGSIARKGLAPVGPSLSSSLSQQTYGAAPWQKSSAQSGWKHRALPGSRWQVPSPRPRSTALLCRQPRRGCTRGTPTKEQTSRLQQCGLTRRSRRGPTASHQARAGGTGTLSPARAWRLTVGPASTPTLGLACHQFRPQAVPRSVGRFIRTAAAGPASAWHLSGSSAPPPVLDPQARANTNTWRACSCPMGASGSPSPVAVPPPLRRLPMRGLPGRGLTTRSRRGPTALRLARAAPGYMMLCAGKAQCRWSHLTSNVRPRETRRAVLQQNQRLSPRTEQPRRG